jgi:glycine/D-amino acid oxidase-like deaminating enzyme
MARVRYVIVGTGFAGAATACFLAASGAGDVLLVEQEPVPGAHASGLNAGMARQIVLETTIAPLAREGCSYIRAWAANANREYFRKTGSLLLVDEAKLAEYSPAIDEARDAGLSIDVLAPSQAEVLAPMLAGADYCAAIHCPTDGIVDISALLFHYLEQACANGARIIYQQPVCGVDTKNGRVRHVYIGANKVPCDVLINAAGPWANTLAELAGISRKALTPYRRHLFASAPMPDISASMPFVWDVAHEFYFRAEQQGLLLSACDRVAQPPARASLDEKILDLLALKVSRHVPSLETVMVTRQWAGLRTENADGTFIIGWDESIENFFWIAGLGGHGMTCSAAIGRQAARTLLNATVR